MLCPFCREKDTSVVDSRPTEDGAAIRRRRVCGCERKERFTTFERVQFRELTVVKNNGFKIFSGGTDTHLMLVDLRPFNVTGKAAETSLGKANITCNKNGIPFDTQKMTITSGIRLGTQAATTRGFGLNEFKKVGDLITEVVEGLSKNPDDNTKNESEVRNEVIDLCSKFPIYNHLIKK